MPPVCPCVATSPRGWHVYTIKTVAPRVGAVYGNSADGGPTGKAPEPEVNHGVENDAG
ncbi:MAG: hypothetical protein LKK39_00320 [Oscillospiraceae bacterium]|nr:hypothetical protein [Oscillospiraceae bacterium]